MRAWPGAALAAPTPADGMQHLARAVTSGDLAFSTALDQLLSAHGRMFGFPGDIESLEDRLSYYLLKVVDRADAREVVAAEGGTVARVREDWIPAWRPPSASIHRGR